MKNQAIQYLALDVHQATVVASLRDESGEVVLRATMATEAKVIRAFVNAGPRVHVAFEEGTPSRIGRREVQVYVRMIVEKLADSFGFVSRQVVGDHVDFATFLLRGHDLDEKGYELL